MEGNKQLNFKKQSFKGCGIPGGISQISTEMSVKGDFYHVTTSIEEGIRFKGENEYKEWGIAMDEILDGKAN